MNKDSKAVAEKKVEETLFPLKLRDVELLLWGATIGLFIGLLIVL